MNEQIIIRDSSQMERLLKPYAGEELAPHGLSEWRFFPRSGVSGFRDLPHPSEILHDHSELGWQVGELYDRMPVWDTELGGLWQKREKALLQLPRYIRPADSSPAAQETAEFNHKALSIVPQRVVNIQHNLSAISHGMSIEELIWEKISRGPLAGAWLPVDLIDRPMSRFTFDEKTHELYIRRRSGQPLKAPPFKFRRLTHGTKDHPWGDPLFDKVFWFTFLKKHGLKYWAIHAERFSSPLINATYTARPGKSAEAIAFNEEQQRVLLRLVSDIRMGRAIVKPEGITVGFLEASRGGDASYGAFLSYLARGQALLVLGEVDTSGMAKGPGSFAKAEVSNEVRLETVQHDAGVLSSYDSDTLHRWITWINFGPDAPVPKAVYDAMDAGDRRERSRGIKEALAVGERVPKSYARMTWQIPSLMDGEEFIERQQKTPAEPAPALSLPSRGGVRLAAAADLEELGAAAELLDQDLGDVVDLFVPSTTGYYSAQHDRLVDLWAADPANPELLQALVKGERPELQAEALETAQIHGAGVALWHLQSEISLSSRAGIRLELPPEWRSALTPATALEFWLRLLVLPKDVFTRLVDGIRRLAFTVAGLTEGTILVESHRLLSRAIAESMDRATFAEELQDLYSRHGLDPISKWHAELIYSNNVRQAAHLVRWQQTVDNPAAHRLTPYLMWWTIGDDRVRQRPLHDHAVMHGYIAAIGHEIWRTWWPLAGHNCRCGVASINLAAARRRGLTGAEPSGPWPLAPGTGERALPDPGFRGRPRLDLIASDVIDRSRLVVEEAQREGSGDLLAALRSLFTALGLAAEVFFEGDLR